MPARPRKRTQLTHADEALGASEATGTVPPATSSQPEARRRKSTSSRATLGIDPNRSTRGTSPLSSAGRAAGEAWSLSAPRQGAAQRNVRGPGRAVLSARLAVPATFDRDERAFVAAPDRRLLDEGYLLADYLIETSDDPWKAAVHFCREQSTALWRRVGVDEDYRPRHAALVVDLTVESEGRPCSVPALARPGQKFRRLHLRIAHPALNFGARIPNLLTALCGEGAFFTPHVPLVLLEDVQFPASFLEQFEGPRFGIEGIRAVLGVKSRPIFCGVIKPNIGMPIEPFAELACQALRGGADIVKDDEMLADTDYAPLAARAACVFPRVRDASRETGERKLYLVNITDEVARLGDLYDTVASLGGASAACMLNAMPIGLSAARMIAARGRMPLFAHFDMIASCSRVPYHGISSLVWTRLQRLAGFDAIIMPGLSDRMNVTVAQVLRDMAACVEPMGAIRPALPMPGGSDWAGTLQTMYETFKTVDFGVVPGRGIFGHPSGPAAGARSLRDAWACIAQGLDPRDPAHQSPPLAEAFKEFGP